MNKTGGDDNNARYDSLVIKGQKRMSGHGSSSWTFSKSFDRSFGAASTSSPPACCHRIPTIWAEYGLALVNTLAVGRTPFATSLPFGKGKSLAERQRQSARPDRGRVAGELRKPGPDGLPLAITQNSNLNAPIGTGVQRPNATGISPVTSGRIKITSGRVPRSEGTSPTHRNSRSGNVQPHDRLPRSGANWDVSLLKTFRCLERYHGQFRAEAMNVFNTGFRQS